MTAFCAATALLVALPMSIDRSAETGVSIHVGSAQARLGRPATPASAAGVARRTTRRGVAAGAAVAAPKCALVNGVRVCR
jgi:hypothetical protein